MDRLKELKIRQQELNKELEKVVEDIYSELGNCKVGDLFFSGEEYLKILSIDQYRAEVLEYSFIDNKPFINTAIYNFFQLDYDKVDNDNGTLSKIINYLSNYD